MATYPDGTLLKASGPEVDQMEGGQRRGIPDLATFNCMGLNWNTIQTITDDVWNQIPQGTPYPSRADGTLLQGSDPKVYVMQGCQRCWIPDPDTFNALGYHGNAIQHVADADLTAIVEGKQLPSVDAAQSQLAQVQAQAKAEKAQLQYQVVVLQDQVLRLQEDQVQQTQPQTQAQVEVEVTQLQQLQAQVRQLQAQVPQTQAQAQAEVAQVQQLQAQVQQLQDQVQQTQDQVWKEQVQQA